MPEEPRADAEESTGDQRLRHLRPDLRQVTGSAQPKREGHLELQRCREAWPSSGLRSR